MKKEPRRRRRLAAVVAVADDGSAHRGEVRNRLSAAVGWRELVGRGSGEAFQLELTGSGTVYVQASEEKL